MIVRRLSIALGIIIAIMLLIAAPYVLSDFYLSTLDEIFIYGLFAMSVNILMGYTGLITLGQAAFFGLGAYTCAYLTATQHVSFIPAFLAGIVLSALASVVFGLFAIRTTRVYFIMFTIAENMLVYGLAYRLYNLTGAENGLSGVSRPDIFQADWQYFYFSVAVVIVTIVLIWRLVRSPFGLTLMGIRESESRMRTLGYNVALHKLISFTIAGTIAGLAGCLYAFYSTYVSVTVVEITQSSEGFLMVMIGGNGTLFGPLLGSVILTTLKEFVSLYTDRWQLVLGVVLVFVMLFARQGILGIGARLIEQRQHIQPPPSPPGERPEEQAQDIAAPDQVAEKEKSSAHIDGPEAAST